MKFGEEFKDIEQHVNLFTDLVLLFKDLESRLIYMENTTNGHALEEEYIKLLKAGLGMVAHVIKMEPKGDAFSHEIWKQMVGKYKKSKE